MFQKILIVLLILILAVMVMFFFRGKASQQGKALGVSDGKLAQCSSKPNCACSEYPDDDIHYVEPIEIGTMDMSQAWAKIKTVIESTGGTIQQSTDNYLSATYTSSFFKFVDDLEIRADAQNNVLHIRSASREGYSDMGVNAKRVAAIKAAFKE